MARVASPAKHARTTGKRESAVAVSGAGVPRFCNGLGASRSFGQSAVKKSSKTPEGVLLARWLRFPLRRQDSDAHPGSHLCGLLLRAQS